MQKPIGVARSAWWPGGRPQVNADPISPASTASTAAIAAPEARIAASKLAPFTTVSGSSAPPPSAQMRSQRLEVAAVVDGKQRLERRRRRLGDLGAGRRNRLGDGVVPGRPLRVRARIVTPEHVGHVTADRGSL